MVYLKLYDDLSRRSIGLRRDFPYIYQLGNGENSLQDLGYLGYQLRVEYATVGSEDRVEIEAFIPVQRGMRQGVIVHTMPSS